MNESGNQKGNLSYLAGIKKRSDSLIQLIFHKRGARAGDDARALFLINTVEERVEALDPLHRIAPESFLIAGRQDDSAPDVINDSCACFYGTQTAQRDGDDGGAAGPPW
jgi:hypothetical protein